MALYRFVARVVVVRIIQISCLREERVWHHAARRDSRSRSLRPPHRANVRATFTAAGGEGDEAERSVRSRGPRSRRPRGAPLLNESLGETRVPGVEGTVAEEIVHVVLSWKVRRGTRTRMS